MPHDSKEQLLAQQKKESCDSKCLGHYTEYTKTVNTYIENKVIRLIL